MKINEKVKDSVEKALSIDGLKSERMTWRGEGTEYFTVTDKDNALYGIVRSRYFPVSHAQAIASVSEFIPDGEIVSVSGNGNFAVACFTINLPRMYKLDGEEVKPQVHLWNSLDGTRKLGFSLGALQLVCKNGLRLFKAFVSIDVKHTQNVSGRFYGGASLLADVYATIEGEIAAAERLKSLPLTTQAGRAFFESLAKKKILPQKIAEAAASRYELPVFENERQQNMLGALNSLTDILTRHNEERNTLRSFEQLDLAAEAFKEVLQTA